MNVLYDKDHYKLALSQLSTARHLIDHVAKDYVRYVLHVVHVLSRPHLRVACSSLETLFIAASSSNAPPSAGTLLYFPIPAFPLFLIVNF